MTISPDDIERDANVKTFEPKVKANGAESARALLFRNASNISLNIDAPYVVKNLIAPGEVSLWYGPSSCGKTFLLLYIFWLISQGEEVFGRRVNGGHVLFLEMEPGRIEWRLWAASVAYGPTSRFSYHVDEFNLFADDEAEHLLIAAIHKHKAVAVVIDPLGAASAGADENSFADISLVFSKLRRVAKATNAHVAVVHHTGKDESRGLRGSSHIFASGDLVMSVSTISEDSGERVAEVVKGRDIRRGEQFPFKLCEHVLGVDKDGETQRTFTIEVSDAATERRPKEPLTNLQKMRLSFIKELFADQNLTQANVRPSENMPRQTCVRRSDVLAAFERKGWIARTEGKALKGNERQKFKDILDALESKKYLCANEQWVWLI